MKTKLALTATIFLAGALIPAQAGDKDDVKNAIKKLSEKGNYSWTSTSKRPERPESDGGNSNRFRSGPTEGKTADGMIYLKSTRGDRTSESVAKGDKSARKGDEGWAVREPRTTTDAGGGDGQRRRSGRGFSTRNYRTPAVRAEELLKLVGELKKDGDAYTGALTEEGAKSLVSFWGGRSRGGGDGGGDAAERPQPTGVKATAKFWVKDGVLAKYESVVEGKIKFGDNERDLGRTSTVEIKEIGSTKIDVPDDIKKKLSAEEKPKAEEKKPAGDSKAAEK
jgi:hypothetical protein